MALTKTPFSMIDGNILSVKDFGAKGDNSTDDTAAFQAAFDAASQASLAPDNADGDYTVLIPHGRYKIGSVTCGSRVKIVAVGGVLTPLDLSTSRTHLIKFTGQFNIIEDLTIDMAYALNYDCAIWGRGRHFNFVNCVIWRCKSGWVFGDPAWENNATNGWLGDSEIALIGCATVWAINAIRVFGQNSIILITGGSLLYSYKAAIPVGHPNYTAWMALPVNTYVNCGGIIHITGSSCCNFSDTDALFLSKLQIIDPVAQPLYKNRYGTFTVTGCHVESGKYLTAETSVYTAADDTTDLLNMVNCHGYTNTSGANWIIDAGGNCKQRIAIRDCDFYGGDQKRVCYSLAAPVSIDFESFRTTSDAIANNSIDAEYQTGKKNFYAVYSTDSSQTISASVETQLAFATDQPCDVSTGREWINNSTGAITVRNKCRNVRLEVGLYLTGATITEYTEFFVYVNGAGSLAPVRTSFGAAVGASWTLPELAAGAVITIKAKQSGGRTCDGSAANFVSLIVDV